MKLAFDLDAACKHLSATDPVMAGLIQVLAPMTDGAQRQQRSVFEGLLRAIAYQQLSGKAAGTIHGRVLDLFPALRPKPQALLAMPEQALRDAGLSRNKVLSIRDLAAKVLDGTVPSARALGAMDDEEIIARLVAVRGIGRWTAEMLLIFQLGRPDILPVDDLGVRRGYKMAYHEADMPKPKALAKVGERWAPYRSVAAWYLWRASE